jgi:hypothetical protein
VKGLKGPRWSVEYVMKVSAILKGVTDWGITKEEGWAMIVTVLKEEIDEWDMGHGERFHRRRRKG